MVQKANTRFIVFSILWIVIWSIIIKIQSGVGAVVILILDPGAASPMTLIYKYGLLLTTIGCIATAFVVWGAGFFALKSVKKHIPDLESTVSLKKTAKIFYWILAGIGMFLSVIMLLGAAFMAFCYVDIDIPKGFMIIFVTMMMMTSITYTAVPLFMLAFSRKQIDKLYNSYM